MNRNPFESMKEIPFLNEEFFRELAEMDWPFPGNLFGGRGDGRWPPLDMVETPEELVITAAIPGLSQAGDVSVLVKGNILTMEGVIPAEHHSLTTVKVHTRERREKKFSRTINLPVAVDVSRARATYRQGILEIRLPKLSGSYAQSVRIDFQK